MGVARLFGLCVALLFASSVNAAVTIDLGPSDYRNWGSGNYQHRPGGIGSSFGQGVRLSQTLGTLNVTRNPVIPYGSVVNGMKNFVRINPASAAASAAVTAAFLAMDWYFDQDSGEWVGGAEDEITYVDATEGGWVIASAPAILYPSTQAACSASPGCASHGACTPGLIRGNIICHVPGTNNERNLLYSRSPECPAGSELTTLGCAVVESVPVPLTAADWQELEGELVTMPPAIAGGSADDIMQRQGQIPGYHDTTITGPSSVSGPSTTSTSTDPVTGDTIVTNTNTTTNINYGDTTITTNNTTTTTTYQNGQETSTTVTTETPGELPVTDTGGGGAIGEWPGFCDWATVLCDWLAWTQEDPPPEQELPSVIDDDFFEEKRISFGSKSCPPDHEINLAPFLETTVGVSFQPLCDFAGLIYYMVMAASYIIAAYISIGVARNA